MHLVGATRLSTAGRPFVRSFTLCRSGLWGLGALRIHNVGAGFKPALTELRFSLWKLMLHFLRRGDIYLDVTAETQPSKEHANGMS